MYISREIERGRYFASVHTSLRRDTLTATSEQPPMLTFTFYSLQSIKVKARVYKRNLKYCILDPMTLYLKGPIAEVIACNKVLRSKLGFDF